MKHLLTLLILTVLILPTAVSAETIYSHVAVTSGVTDTGHLTGAPDGASATFGTADSWVELGFPQISTGNVVLQYTVETDNIFSMTVLFMNGPSIEHTALVAFIGTAPTGTEEIQNLDNVSFDRIRITPSEPLFGVDAAWIDADPIEPVVPEPEDTPTDQPLPVFPNQHSSYPELIKLVSDNNPATTHDTAVYAVDSEGKRRPFTNETVYYSWFTDFGRVTEVSPSAMAAIPLGATMPMHHGTWLIKIQSASDVYAVERDNTLRRIPDEATAAYFYGPDWASRVRDLPPTDWPRYTVGEDLTFVHPDELIARDDNLVVWHVRNGIKRQISENDLAFHGIQEEIIIPYNTLHSMTNAAEELLETYTTGFLYDRLDTFGWYDF